MLANPFGTIFNPLSVCLLLEAAAGKAYPFENHLVQHKGIWYAYDLHSSLSSPSRDKLLETIRERVAQTRTHLQQARLLIVTLGTAVAYKLRQNDRLVANCHKLPAGQFTRLILSTSEIVAAFAQMHALIKQINPQLQVLLTVSPVRHIKETIPVNSVSKATLRLVCHQLEEQFADVRYFPAFEIMMDDLRDYRFYKQDMLHPTALAEDYIWQKFVDAYFNQEFRAFLSVWDKIRRAVAHQPFHPASDAHQAFLRNTLAQLQQLAAQYHIDTEAEAALLRQQISTP